MELDAPGPGGEIIGERNHMEFNLTTALEKVEDNEKAEYLLILKLLNN